eukprot:1073989-Prorocentrum_minimum.AAC.5
MLDEKVPSGGLMAALRNADVVVLTCTLVSHQTLNKAANSPRFPRVFGPVPSLVGLASCFPALHPNRLQLWPWKKSTAGWGPICS